MDSVDTTRKPSLKHARTEDARTDKRMAALSSVIDLSCMDDHHHLKDLWAAVVNDPNTLNDCCHSVDRLKNNINSIISSYEKDLAFHEQEIAVAKAKLCFAVVANWAIISLVEEEKEGGEEEKTVEKEDEDM